MTHIHTLLRQAPGNVKKNIFFKCIVKLAIKRRKLPGARKKAATENQK